MSGTTVVTTEPTQGDTPAALDPAAEIAHAEARVDVAEIEAARDVEIAEVHAETEQAAVDAAVEIAKENATKEEVEECQRNLQATQSQLAAMEQTVSLIQKTLEERLPPLNQAETDNPASAEDARPAQEPEPAKRKHRIV